MPTISVFYGIVIRMFARDHPPPHFHVRYGEHRARVSILSGELLDGFLPARVERLVRQWASLRASELEHNWHLIEQGEQPIQIEGLS